ncbi:MAG: electron transport complex subunit RsxC [candidate division KSB1 bacterium]|nr:electron transport complex subunit RsxC [candidate division KSB1 bacterium]
MALRILTRRGFRGGVHPPENKELTAEKPIEILPPPPVVVIPVQQHIGAPGQPIVQAGDRVRVGDRLTEPGGYVSVPVHASISGIVKAIEPRPHPLGTTALSIVIEGDGQDEWSDTVVDDEAWDQLPAEEIRERIRMAGLAGMGGAAFPTHVKLSPPPNKPIDTFILNGAECEPYLTADHRLMLEYPEEIVRGMKIILRVLRPAKAFIAIEDNKMDAVRAMRQAVQREGLSCEVVALPVKYPQGAEKQLIKALTGREVPRGGLPMDVGCLVHNVGTARAIYQAVAKRRPVIDRVVTVTGRGVVEPKNLLVRIGTPFSFVLEHCGGIRDGAARVLMGGPMMGIAQFTLDVPVVKGTSGIVVLNQEEVDRRQMAVCIRCARCIDACPMGLMPTTLYHLVKAKRFEGAQDYGVLDCIECGSCAYVCPAGLPLVHAMKWGKMEVSRKLRAAG